MFAAVPSVVLYCAIQYVTTAPLLAFQLLPKIPTFRSEQWEAPETGIGQYLSIAHHGALTLTPAAQCPNTCCKRFILAVELVSWGTWRGRYFKDAWAEMLLQRTTSMALVLLKWTDEKNFLVSLG
jgi:hypothetical protein